MTDPTLTKPLRTLIVDDEPLAIERMQVICGDLAGIEVVGTGGAEKAQVQAMLKVLLPGVTPAGADAADALAVAITHAHLNRG
mgnify:CR=1 FL=1